MPTQHHHANPVRRAHALAEWIDDLNLPPNIRNPLLRDLDAVVSRGHAVAGNSGHLRGLDADGFRAQLARPGGGVVARVRGMGAGRIAALRELLAASDERTAR
ncbi:MAG: hypothetical protein WCG26_09725 [Chloroflexales bacterium]